LPAILGIFFISCIQKVEHPARVDFSRYFPLVDGSVYQYSGPLGKAVVSGQINELFTFTYFDSTGKITGWNDFIRTDHSVGWKNIISRGGMVPALHFEPPLPFNPWSMTVGDTVLFSAAEIRGDSLNSHLRIQTELEVISIAPVTTPAGEFTDCIGIRMSFKALYSNHKKLLNGNFYWWFAREVGLVKYILPEGTGELLHARIGGRAVP
jgi:hypothetical protein